jgi:hypothetical protein
MQPSVTGDNARLTLLRGRGWGNCTKDLLRFDFVSVSQKC